MELIHLVNQLIVSFSAREIIINIKINIIIPVVGISISLLFTVIMGSFPHYSVHVSYFFISYSSFGRVYKDTHHLKMQILHIPRSKGLGRLGFKTEQATLIIYMHNEVVSILVDALWVNKNFSSGCLVSQTLPF